MKVLGIDPGTRIVGYAVVDQEMGQFHTYTYGAVVTQPHTLLSQRLKAIYETLTKIMVDFQPHAGAIEKICYGKNLQTAIRTGEGRGVALLAAAMFQLPVYEYDATKIKKSVAGVGSAHKTQVQAMVQAILQLPQVPNPLDASDALAIAICHLQHFQPNISEAGGILI